MHTPTLTKTFTAEGAVSARRIVKTGTADGNAVAAAADTDAAFGVSAEVAALDTERVDVHMSGVVEVEFGGTVARGDLVTSDAAGAAVAAAPAAGVNARVVGVAMVSGVAGDIGSVLINPGQIQG